MARAVQPREFHLIATSTKLIRAMKSVLRVKTVTLLKTRDTASVFTGIRLTRYGTIADVKNILDIENSPGQ